MKQTVFLYFKFPLKPKFFSVFLLFLEREILAYFKFVYSYTSRPNFSMEGDKEGIFIEAPDWKLLFFLKLKIKQNPGCSNKQYKAIFKHIKNLHWSMIGKI